MKYHYFHGRFTYSVKRSGSFALSGFCLFKVRWLDSCVEACAVCFDRGRAGDVGRRALGLVTRRRSLRSGFGAEHIP